MKFVLLVLISIFSMAAVEKFTVNVQSYLTATVTSAQILGTNNNRKYLLIQNTGAQSIILKFDTVQSASEGIVISAGGNYEPISAPTDPLFIRSASGTSTYTLIEGQ